MPREVSTTKYVAFVRRVLRALGNRIDIQAPEEFAEIVGLADELEDIVREAMDAYVARDAHLAPQQRTNTWTAIGAALGISRQQAEQTWSKRGRERQRQAEARWRERRAAAETR